MSDEVSACSCSCCLQQMFGTCPYSNHKADTGIVTISSRSFLHYTKLSDDGIVKSQAVL